MAECKTLLDLPVNMLWYIMICVGADSVKDFVKMKLCCTRLKALGEHPYMWRSISLRGLSYYNSSGRHGSFLHQCIANNNPEALYRAGVDNFFGGNYPCYLGPTVGLVQLAAVSDADHLYATYTQGFLKIFNWDGDVPLVEEGYRLLGKVCSASKELECRRNFYDHMRCFWPARTSTELPPVPQAQCRQKHWKSVDNWSEEYEDFEDPSCIDCRCDAEIQKLIKTFYWANLAVYSYM